MRGNRLIISVVLALTLPGSIALGQAFSSSTQYPVGEFPRGICTADFNGDTYLDLAVTNRGDDPTTDTDSISILFNNGDGTFAAAVAYLVGVQPAGICTADLDNDNYMDLAVTNWESDNISVLKNDGSGNFSPAVNYAAGPAGAAPRSIVAVDLSGDNIADLAFGNERGDVVGVLKNQGNGTFYSVVTYPVGPAPWAITAGDFDKDLAMDVATANSNDDSVSVLLGNGDATFADSVNYEVGDLPRSVAAADVDNDGWIDLVVSNYGTHNISVLINNQDGTFAAAANYFAASNPRGICAVEINGDAFIDLAVVNYTSHEVSILINNGDGTFPTHEEIAVGLNPVGIVAGDFDKDGSNDLAVTNLGSNSVSVLLNGEINTDVAGDLDDVLPGRVLLHQNYPNPFNPATIIEFALASRGHVSLGVYNISGQKIKQLADREFAAGNHALNWDGSDELGEPVASGIYFYRLAAGDYVESKKMVLLK